MTRQVANPPNPWLSSHVEYLGEPPDAPLEVFEEEAKSILSRNDSPDLPFRWSVNPYRGCFHACAYCYARPTHQYLGWGAGSDFDRRIVAKTNAAELLETALARRTWKGEMVAFSGVTDCYQPLEASYELTRRCLQVCARRDNAVGIITKGALVERDAELLAELEQRAGALVFVSVPFADDELGRAIEPTAPLPSRRIQTIARLSAAGVPTGVAVAPVIPGLNDDHIPRILSAAREAGAQRAFLIALRLPAEVAGVFEERLRAAAPMRAARVMSAVREMRNGGVNDHRFGTRMRGAGERWSVVENLFKLHCRKLGMAYGEAARAERLRPQRRQGELFGR